MEIIPLSTSHSDVVNDVAFDYYGNRLASCSSDKHIKVTERTPMLKISP